MSKEDVHDLFQEIENELDNLRKYRKITKTRFKFVLECLRSSLEYMAQDINKKLSNPKKKLYFPYGETEEIFKSNVAKHLPSLEDEFPEIYSSMENLQPYMSDGDKWLVIMCSLTNEVKHEKLIENIEREKIKSVSIGDEEFVAWKFFGGNGSTVVLDGEINGKRISPFQIIQSNEAENDQIIHYEKMNPKIDFKVDKEKELFLEGNDPIRIIPKPGISGLF